MTLKTKEQNADFSHADRCAEAREAERASKRFFKGIFLSAV
jgi:hypothetical protein